MKSGKELRASTRVPVNFKVDWKSEGTFLFENATNISEHGIFIETKKVQKKGTKLNLQFTVPETKQKINAQGEVIWVNKPTSPNGSTGMGIRFIKLSDVDRSTILALIKRIAVLESQDD